MPKRADWDENLARYSFELDRFEDQEFIPFLEGAHAAWRSLEQKRVAEAEYYISQMLVRFVRNDAIYGLRTPRGERLSAVADMLQEAQARKGSARRRIHRHIGDYTLFWSGVYPEIADRMRGADARDSLLNYLDQGKRNYYIASTLPPKSRNTASSMSAGTGATSTSLRTRGCPAQARTAAPAPKE